MGIRDSPCTWADPEPSGFFPDPKLWGQSSAPLPTRPQWKSPLPLQLQSHVFRSPFIASSIMSPRAPSAGAKQLKSLPW